MTASAAPARADPRVLFDGDILADYFQIYLRDLDYPDLPDHYGEEELDRRLMIGPYAAIVHTARNMAVPVLVEWHALRPRLQMDGYQHVVEAGFGSPSGTLLLAGMTDDEATASRLTVQAGRLGVRVSMSGLDTISNDGLEGSDRYLVQLWPASVLSGPRVLKAWQER